jgi:hypothetical protein
LANFSGINNLSVGVSGTYIYFASSNMNYVNIIPSTTINPFDTFTFNLSGKYLFQYNVNVSTSPTTIEFTGKVNGVTGVDFGTQTISSSGNYGCSIIQNLTAGDSISLIFTSAVTWSFASLTIIKL